MMRLMITLYPLRVIRQLSTSIGLYPAPLSTNLSSDHHHRHHHDGGDDDDDDDEKKLKPGLLGLLCHHITNNLINLLSEQSKNWKQKNEKNKKKLGRKLSTCRLETTSDKK